MRKFNLTILPEDNGKYVISGLEMNEALMFFAVVGFGIGLIVGLILPYL